MYKKTYAELKEALAKNKAEPFQNILSDVKEDDPETYVVIIGESAKELPEGDYETLAGFIMDELQCIPKNGEMNEVVFENVKSPFAQTMPVLERVLTFAEEGKMNFLTEKGTIVNYFKQAGFKTYWLSNQYALSDTLITAISSHADWEKSYNFSGMKRFEKTGFDGDMLPDIERILNDKSSHKKVVFVHLIGSHSAYTNRYPSDWAHFKDHLKNKNLICNIK